MRKLVSIFFFGIAFLAGGFFSVAQAQPAFPDQFAVLPRSACVVDLRWNQPIPGATYFLYERSTRGFNLGPGLQTRIPPGSQTFGSPVTGSFSTVSSQLVSDTDYWYRVKACDANACSNNPSFPAGWTEDATSPKTTPSLPNPPLQAIILKATSTRSTDFSVNPPRVVQDVRLSWATSSVISRYGGFSIWRSENGGTFLYQGFLPNLPGVPLEYQQLGLNVNSFYTYYVTAYDSDDGCIINPAIIATGPLNQAVFSSNSNQVVIPRGPSGLAGSSVGGATPVVNLTWADNSSNESNFEIWKTTNLTCFQFPGSCPSSIFSILNTGANVTNYQDSVVLPNTTYYYRVRACAGPNFLGCSVFAPDVIVPTGVSAPSLRGGITYASAGSQTGTVFLNWGGGSGANGYIIQRSTSSNFLPSNTVVNLITKLPTDQPDFYDQNVPLGQGYYYRLLAAAGTQISYSNIVPANLAIDVIVRGVAWAAIGGTPTQFSGPGWIKFSSTPENGSSPSAINYSVQADNNGLLSGAGWASVQLSGGRRGYGWLSFNEHDLIGCPSAVSQTTPGAPCEARIQTSGPNTNKMTGWARFLSPAIYAGRGWDGWVSLGNDNPGIALNSEINKFASPLASVFSPLASLLNLIKTEAATAVPYGPVYDPDTKTFSGAAWGGDGIGWIAFGPPECANCNVRADSINRAPSVSNIRFESDPNQWCAPVPFYRVRWDYQDPDTTANNQIRYEVQYVNTANSADKVTRTFATSDWFDRFDDPLGFNTLGTYGGANFLKPSQTYNVLVRSADGLNSWSNWELASSTIIAVSHYYPLVDFVSTATSTGIGTSYFVSFNNQTIDRSEGASPKGGWVWNWTFTNASPNTSVAESPGIVSYSALPNDAGLTVIDGTKSCSLIDQVTVSGATTTLRRRILKEN